MIYRNRDVLAVLAGERPNYPKLSYDGVEIVIMSEEKMKRNPLEVLREMTEKVR